MLTTWAHTLALSAVLTLFTSCTESSVIYCTSALSGRSGNILLQQPVSTTLLTFWGSSKFDVFLATTSLTCHKKRYWFLCTWSSLRMLLHRIPRCYYENCLWGATFTGFCCSFVGSILNSLSLNLHKKIVYRVLLFESRSKIQFELSTSRVSYTLRCKLVLLLRYVCFLSFP